MTSIVRLPISVVRYLRYLDKYREYQRLDTSIEEVSIYRNTTILPRIVMIPVSILAVYD